ncbi:hypothetical protein OK074_0014 [Actinobacteria bacterium OK074]|nr:hypothetical protein OK074_0014 [Actinobacteria bacterium OK074]
MTGLPPAEDWEQFRIAVSTRTQWLVPRVSDQDGAYGYGECSDAGSLSTVRELRWFAGPFDPVAPRSDGPGDSYARDDFATVTVRGGVEQARLDRSGPARAVAFLAGDDASFVTVSVPSARRRTVRPHPGGIPVMTTRCKATARPAPPVVVLVLRGVPPCACAPTPHSSPA